MPVGQRVGTALTARQYTACKMAEEYGSIKVSGCVCITCAGGSPLCGMCVRGRVCLYSHCMCADCLCSLSLKLLRWQLSTQAYCV